MRPFLQAQIGLEGPDALVPERLYVIRLAVKIQGQVYVGRMCLNHGDNRVHFRFPFWESMLRHGTELDQLALQFLG